MVWFSLTDHSCSRNIPIIFCVIEFNHLDKENNAFRISQENSRFSFVQMNDNDEKKQIILHFLDKTNDEIEYRAYGMDGNRIFCLKLTIFHKK